MKEIIEFINALKANGVSEVSISFKLTPQAAHPKDENLEKLEPFKIEVPAEMLTGEF